MGCHFLLQGIFLTQENEPASPALQVDSLPLSHQGSPEWRLSKWYTFIVLLNLYNISFGPNTAFPKDFEFFNSFYPQSRSCKAGTITDVGTGVQRERLGSLSENAQLEMVPEF